MREKAETISRGAAGCGSSSKRQRSAMRMIVRATLRRERELRAS